MKLFSRVKLCTNKFKNDGVNKGDIGYIIEAYDDDNYEVEFSNCKTGETIAQIVVTKKDIKLPE